jgi:metal-dependent HD superfamily phosphatase/phosphodiesterase
LTAIPTEDEIVTQIHDVFKTQGYSNWVLNDFVRIKDNKMIRILLDRAYMETAKRDFKNRHGIMHGLSTAYNTLILFELLSKGAVKSDYMEIFELSKDEVLFTLMTAGLIHDSGRFYEGANVNHEEHVNDAIAVLQKLLQSNDILSKSVNIISQEMIKRVKELSLCHDKKYEPSGKAEIALIKLADALDTGPHRVYDKEDHPELAKDDETKYATIFQKDKFPGRYFGPLSIERVDFTWKDTEKVFEIVFVIKDFACADEIKKTLNVLGGCIKNGHLGVRALATKVHVYIEFMHDPKKRRFRIHPSAEDLQKARAESTQIPYAKLPYMGYEIDVLNMEGDVNMLIPMQLTNVLHGDGIDSQPAILGGYAATSWDAIGLRWFEKERKGLKKLPKASYLRSDRQGLNHHYLIQFGRKLGMGKTIALVGKCHWPKFINVLDDKMVHTVSTPTEKLKISIGFPHELDNFTIEASYQVKNPVNGEVLLKTSLEPKKIGGRWRLEAMTSALATTHSYGIFWKCHRS